MEQELCYTIATLFLNEKNKFFVPATLIAGIMAVVVPLAFLRLSFLFPSPLVADLFWKHPIHPKEIQNKSATKP